MDPRLLVGALMGWTLGANDTASVFGLAITTRIVRARTALPLTAGFILLGAVLQGQAGIQTYAALAPHTIEAAFIVSLTPALALWLTATLGLPISATQAVVGAAAGLALAQGQAPWATLAKLGTSWAVAPLGATLTAVVLYVVFGRLVERWLRGWSAYGLFLKVGFLIVGSYGAYALGANNVANVAGVWVGSGAVTLQQGVWWGALAIGAGVITYSGRVIDTLGRKLTDLDPFAAFIAVLSNAIVLHSYAILGVPVSASQAMVGAVLGIGLVKGVRTIQRRTVIKVLLAWFVVPLVTGTLAVSIGWLVRQTSGT